MSLDSLLVFTRFCFFFACDGAICYVKGEGIVMRVENIPGVLETLYIINASPLSVLAISSSFFHSEIQWLLSMDLVSSSTAEFMLPMAAFAFWYFRHSDATAITFGELLLMD